MPDSLQVLGRLLAAALPGSGLDDTAALLAELGWEEPPGGADLGLDKLDPGRVLAALAKLDLAVSLGTDTGAGIGVHAELLTEVLGLLDRIDALAAALPARLAGAGAYAATTGIATELAPRLVAYLLIRSVELRVPALYVALVATGVFRLEAWQPDPAKHQVGHLHYAIDIERLRTLLTDPTALMRDRYGWGTPALDTGKLVAAFGALLQLFGLPASLGALPGRVEARLTGLAVPAADPLPRVSVSLLRGVGWDGLDVGLVVHGLRPSEPARHRRRHRVHPIRAGQHRRALPARARPRARRRGDRRGAARARSADPAGWHGPGEGRHPRRHPAHRRQDPGRAAGHDRRRGPPAADRGARRFAAGVPGGDAGPRRPAQTGRRAGGVRRGRAGRRPLRAGRERRGRAGPGPGADRRCTGRARLRDRLVRRQGVRARQRGPAGEFPGASLDRPGRAGGRCRRALARRGRRHPDRGRRDGPGHARAAGRAGRRDRADRRA